MFGFFNDKQNNDETPSNERLLDVCDALRNGDDEPVRQYLQDGYDPDARFLVREDNRRILGSLVVWAVRSANPGALELLLEHGADPDRPTQRNKYRYDHETDARHLRVKHKYPLGWTLSVAFDQQDPDDRQRQQRCVELLLEHGATMIREGRYDDQNQSIETRLLAVMMRYSNIHIAEWLIENYDHRIDYSAEFSRGNFLFCLPTPDRDERFIDDREGRVRALTDHLIERGADPTATNDDGHNPLSYAVKWENLGMIRSLVSHGHSDLPVDAPEKSNRGRTTQQLIEQERVYLNEGQDDYERRWVQIVSENYDDLHLFMTHQLALDRIRPSILFEHNPAAGVTMPVFSQFLIHGTTDVSNVLEYMGKQGGEQLVRSYLEQDRTIEQLRENLDRDRLQKQLRRLDERLSRYGFEIDLGDYVEPSLLQELEPEREQHGQAPTPNDHSSRALSLLFESDAIDVDALSDRQIGRLGQFIAHEPTMLQTLLQSSTGTELFGRLLYGDARQVEGLLDHLYRADAQATAQLIMRYLDDHDPSPQLMQWLSRQADTSTRDAAQALCQNLVR